MSGRRSRIDHPQGGRYIRIDLWAKEALGDPCSAACLSVLEFFDRLKDKEGEWLGRNAGDVQKMLAGLYGRDKVRAGIDLLVKKGWVDEKEESILLGQLWSRRRDLRLCPRVINRFIHENSNTSEICDFQEPGFPETRKTGSLNSVVNNKACKPNAAAELKPAAAIVRKRRRPRKSGMVCFYDEDDIAAERIERSYTSDEITFACSEVVSLKREPVPGVVERSILDRRTRIARDGKQQAQISALANSPPKNPGHNIKKIWSDFHQCKRE